MLWLACKEAIVGSANLVGNLLSPLWFQNKDPSTASETSLLAGFRLHQWSRILCVWLDHTQYRGLFTTKANDDASSDVNTMPQWKLFSYFENDWCWYGRFFVQNIPFTLPVILFNTSAPASLMQKNPQRCKIICGMRFVGHDGRSIDLRVLS